LVEFGSMLRSLREAKHLHQNEVAFQVGISRAYLSAIERGQAQNISSDVLAKLGRVLGIAPLSLFHSYLEHREPHPVLPPPHKALIFRQCPSIVIDPDALLDAVNYCSLHMLEYRLADPGQDRKERIQQQLVAAAHPLVPGNVIFVEGEFHICKPDGWRKLEVWEFGILFRRFMLMPTLIALDFDLMNIDRATLDTFMTGVGLSFIAHGFNPR
jgi:transcriptional regulator with XRE-family HTH domain